MVTYIYYFLYDIRFISKLYWSKFKQEIQKSQIFKEFISKIFDGFINQW